MVMQSYTIVIVMPVTSCHLYHFRVQEIRMYVRDIHSNLKKQRYNIEMY